MTPTERQIIVNQQRILEAIFNLQQAVAAISKKAGAFTSTEEYLKMTAAPTIDLAGLRAASRLATVTGDYKQLQRYVLKGEKK